MTSNSSGIRDIDKRGLYIAALLFGVVSAAYLNALSNGFVYDDIPLVVKNTRLRGWEGIPAVFTTGYWETSDVNYGLYRPLAILSYLVEHSIAGTRPFLYHLDNVLLHFICSLLVFKALEQIFDDRHTPVFAAVLFAAHPVHTEVVAAVFGRAEMLSVIFTLLSFWLYARRPGRSGLALSCAAFFLGLLSKETAAVLPVLLALYVFLYSERDGVAARLAAVVKLYPYALVFLAYMGLRLAVIGAISPDIKTTTRLLFTGYDLFLVMAEALFHYIRLSLLPFSLTEEYIYRPVGSVLDYRIIVPAAALVSLALFSRRLVREHKPVYFASLWFFVSLLPVSNIIPVGVIMSERALYLPSVGACAVIGAAFSAAYGGMRTGPGGGRARAAALVMFVLVAASFIAGSLARNPVWGDEHLFRERRIKHLERCVKLFPSAEMYALLAQNYVLNGHLGEDAEDAAMRALALDDRNYEAHYYLAQIYMDRGRLEDALHEALTATEIKKEDAAFDLAGTVLFVLGRLDEADRMAGEAIKLKPDYGQYYINRAYIRLGMGDRAEALRLFTRAGELDPGLAYAFIEEGKLLLETGDNRRAVQAFARALEAAPDNEEARRLLDSVR